MMPDMKFEPGIVVVDKALLRMMLSEYWEAENNAACTCATILFLRKVGFNTHEISQIVENDFNITQNDLSEIEDDMEDFMICY